MSYSGLGHCFAKAKNLCDCTAKLRPVEVLAFLSSLPKDLVKNKVCTVKVFNNCLLTERCGVWIRRIVNMLFLAIFFLEIDASVYLLICPTVADVESVLFSLLPVLTPMEAREGNIFQRKYVINKTLPPKELNMPRK